MGKPLTPHPYQEEARSFVMERPGSMLFLDCGLGKTIVTLSAIRDCLLDAEIKGVLIVAPLKVARLTWPLEVDEWETFEWLDYQLLHGPSKSRRLRTPAHIYLINYEGLIWLHNELKKIKVKDWPFDMIVFDESTKMKSYDSTRFKRFRNVAKKMKKRIALTGTPAPNSLLDLWAQTYLIDDGERLGTAYTRFRDRFFDSDYMGYSYELRSPDHEQMIYDLIAPITLRMSAEDYLDMKPVNYIDVPVTLTKEEAKRYTKLEKEMFIQLDARGEATILPGGVSLTESRVAEAPNAAALSNLCRQYTGGAVYYTEEGEDVPKKKPWQTVGDSKMRALKGLLKDIGDEPVLITYSYRHEAERMVLEYPNAVWLKSGLSRLRELQIQEDWNAGRISKLICHPASAGHGLNLQKGPGRSVVHYSLNWSLELVHQLNHRVNRQGQKREVRIYVLVAEGTVDEVVSVCIARKDKGQKRLLYALKKYRESKK